MHELIGTIVSSILAGGVAILVCILNNKNSIQRMMLENELKMDEYSKGTKDETNAIKLGLQALLRAQMISEYNKWSELGYAPLYARQNFENCWEQYHSLGANGVMNNIHGKFLALPTIKPKDGKEKK